MLYRFDGCDKSYSVFLPKQRRSESTARLILFSTSLSLPLSLSLSRCSANIIYDFKTNLLTRFFINIRLKSNKLISAPSLITGGHASWAHILYSIKYEIDVYFFLTNGTNKFIFSRKCLFCRIFSFTFIVFWAISSRIAKRRIRQERQKEAAILYWHFYHATWCQLFHCYSTMMFQSLARYIFLLCVYVCVC